MGSVRFGIPGELVLALQKQTGAQEFVESGAFQGHTAAWAAAHFGQVDTIELPSPWLEEAKGRLYALPNVHLHIGDSRILMIGVVAKLAGPAIFWLDAHWMGSGPKSDKGECGLLDEINAVNLSPARHVILCDDARYFQNPPPPPHNPAEWPTAEQVTEALDNRGARFITVHEDVFIAVPMALKDWLVNRLAP